MDRGGGPKRGEVFFFFCFVFDVGRLGFHLPPPHELLSQQVLQHANATSSFGSRVAARFIYIYIYI